ncbi:ATP-binding protein [Defluviimonas aestuarii]|uniref:ATP-binding protein n=1 Tax=Albidovulum aestuarii TaxID=1130726 RepID=UPI00249CC76B|nr:ATP-binding protein [Defluviimonas aestuarii]MDI3338706.1 ATP-binding protein [Defluviimonas aestuarii]
MLNDLSGGMDATLKPGAAAIGNSAGCRFNCIFRAEPEAVRTALRSAVARFARQISSTDSGTLELTLAEALNNIVEHSYADQPPGLIDLSLTPVAGALACRIEDFGRPMPGCTAPDRGLPLVTPDVTQLPEGGWGWALIRDLSTDLEYERKGNRNVLTFRIPIGDGGDTG